MAGSVDMQLSRPDNGYNGLVTGGRNQIDEAGRPNFTSTTVAASATRAQSSDAALTGAITAHTAARRSSRGYDSDLETESAYQRTMWDRIQNASREIQHMRTPGRDGGFVPPTTTTGESYQEIRRRHDAEGTTNVNVEESFARRGGGGRGRQPPPDYIELNRRQVQKHHVAALQTKYGRRTVVYPGKTYAELFTKKKQNETTYMNVGAKNVFGGQSTFLPFSTGCRCEYNPDVCPCHQPRSRQHPAAGSPRLDPVVVPSGQLPAGGWYPEHGFVYPPHLQPPHQPPLGGIPPHSFADISHHIPRQYNVLPPHHLHPGYRPPMPLPPIVDDYGFLPPERPTPLYRLTGNGRWRPRGDVIVENPAEANLSSYGLYTAHVNVEDRPLQQAARIGYDRSPMNGNDAGKMVRSHDAGANGHPNDNCGVAGRHGQVPDEQNQVQLQLNVRVVDGKDQPLPDVVNQRQSAVPGSTENPKRPYSIHGRHADADADRESRKRWGAPDHWRQAFDRSDPDGNRDWLERGTAAGTRASRQIGPKELEAMEKIRRLRET